MTALKPVRSPHNPWRAFEEAPSRALFLRAGSVGPKRHGLSHATPWRSPAREWVSNSTNCNPHHNGASATIQPLHSTNRPAAAWPAGRKR